MAKPVPSLPDIKFRTTISVPAVVVIAADRVRELHPEEGLRDFSDQVKRAMIEYVTARQPKILQTVVAEIRKKKAVVTKHRLYRGNAVKMVRIQPVRLEVTGTKKVGRR
jgi:hypothetical protein